MQRVYQGSVNRWDCDENDHMNVRFFMERHGQCLAGFLAATGRPVGRVKSQHVRFLREARMATPLTGVAGYVTVGDRVCVLTELRHSFDDAVLSSCVHDLWHIGDTLDGEALPGHAGSRGIADADSVYAACSLGQVADQGFLGIGAGVVDGSECTADGELALWRYMGRLSDSMPHLWSALHASAGELGADEGGAVLEYRLRYHGALGEGDRFEIWSGLAEVGRKAQRFVHLVFSSASGELVVSAEATGVRMDLVARKALALPDPVIDGYRRMLLRAP